MGVVLPAAREAESSQPGGTGAMKSLSTTLMLA